MFSRQSVSRVLVDTSTSAQERRYVSSPGDSSTICGDLHSNAVKTLGGTTTRGEGLGDCGSYTVYGGNRSGFVPQKSGGERRHPIVDSRKTGKRRLWIQGVLRAPRAHGNHGAENETVKKKTKIKVEPPVARPLRFDPVKDCLVPIDLT